MLKFRIFLWSCLFFILGFFIYNGITPGGHKVYCQNFEKQNYFIGKLSPETRAENEIISNIPALRGSYQFFTYIKDEEFNFEFEFLDLNENKDEDQINLHLYYNDTLIKTAHLDDDGIFSDNGSTTKSRIINMQVNDLPEGVYKVELRANDDIVTQKINTKQNKISFLNKLYLYRGGKSNFSIYTDSKKIQSKTVYPGSLQILKSGSSEMIIMEILIIF